MGKNIKKSLKYFIVISGVVILLPTLLFFTLQSPAVQTYLINRITQHFSNELTTHISVGRIEFKFFNRLIINNILIKDQNNDTLIYSKQLRAGIRRIDPRNNIFRLGKVALIEPVFALITDTTGQMNLNWYLDQLSGSPDSSKKEKVRFSIEQAELNNARFSLTDRRSVTDRRGIDFANLHINTINSLVEDLSMVNDTLSFNIHNLSFTESKGFEVRTMNSEVKIAKQNFSFSSTQIRCDSSIINLPELRIKISASDSINKSNDKVWLNINLSNSLISSADLRYFVQFAEKTDVTVNLSGRVSGTISELRGRDIELFYGDYTVLGLDFDISGLPDIENAFIYLGVNTLRTNAKDIEQISLREKGKIAVPEILRKLGDISFTGSFTGFTTDFVTYGKFRSDYGYINTDISLRPEENKRYRIKGLVEGIDIDLGNITGNSEMYGNLNLKTNIDGYAYSLEKFGANIAGRIDSIEINKYLYRNIALDGFITEKTWDGVVRVDDRNLKLDLLGMFSFRDKMPAFDFTLNLSKANLSLLNIDKHDSVSSLKALITSDFKGNSIDNLDGVIRLVNSEIIRFGDTLELKDFNLRSSTDGIETSIALRTDFIDADLNGVYSFATIGTQFKTILSKLMPSRFPAPVVQQGLKGNNFGFRIDFKNTIRINEFFRTGISLAESSYLKGTVFPDSTITIEGNFPAFAIWNSSFKDLSVDLHTSGSTLSFNLLSPSFSILNQPEIKDFTVSLNTKPDNFIFNMNWDNKQKILDAGSITARGDIIKSKVGNNNTILKIDIDSSNIYTGSTLWKLSQSSVSLDSNSVSIDKLYLTNNKNYYLVDGTVSMDPSDTLNLAFRGIDISPLNYLLFRDKISDPESISPDFKGRLNGKILLSNVYKNLLLETGLVINDFSVFNSSFGNLSVYSALNRSKKLVDIKVSNDLGGLKMLDATGYYDPAAKRLNLGIVASKLPVDALNPLLKMFASDISGTASGRVKLSGPTNKLALEGAIMAENTNLKIDYLQTKYRLNDTIRFDKKGFRFSNVKMSDEKGNPAILGGYVYHQGFKDFTADLIITTTEAQVLNTKPKDNELFYGTAYATGVTTIKAVPGLLSFDISAKTGRNTRFFIPLNSGMSVSEYSFVSFSDKQTDGKDTDEKGVLSEVPIQTGIDLNIDLEVTPDAEAQIIFDSKAGDIMKGRGSGDLNISLNKNGDFRISGDYIIEDGDYLFTLGNILNKPFSVENGGRIIFNGELDNAEIDIKAIYKLKASLYDIRLEEKYKERIPVECQLLLTGKLFNPLIGFNIYLPTADEEARSYLRNVISTEEELSRQFLYLLVMNSFYSDPSFSSSVSTPTASTEAMKVTTYEMVSSQLSNWLSQISNDFDIGFVYRPGYNEINPQEVEVALSTQLLNDKVVINGNFDVRGTSQADNNTNQITGDFDAEVKITEKLRFKVFNRYNNPYTGKGVDYTQGIGIFFREDFNKFKDLFRRKEKAAMKKEEALEVKEEKE